MMLSALIVEDHDVTRQGLKSLLEEQLEARVVATTGDGMEAIPLLKEHAPDLLVLDLGLPNLNGLNILSRIERLDLATKVVVLSMHGEGSYVSEAFAHGASGYVLKGSPLEELMDAIHAVMRGEKYLSSELSEDLIDPVKRAQNKSHDRYDALTTREREILQLTAQGFTSREIGEKLAISHRTVEKHRENIQSKLDLRNAVEMTAYAHQHGLVLDSSVSREELTTNGGDDDS
jgi:DNA-binding NarL/FixJ family response regulator